MSPHKTTENLKARGEFTVSVATADQVAACDYVGIVSKNKVPDKLEKCGFTVTKSDKINAPVIDQLPVAVECKVIELQEEFNETRVVAEIVGMKADEKTEKQTLGFADLRYGLCAGDGNLCTDRVRW